MKKILTLSFLMFFVHSFFLEFLFEKFDNYTKHYNGDTDHGMHFIIALFFAFIFFILTIVLVYIEHKMDFFYKSIIFFLSYGNCLLQFYMCSFSEYRLFANSERFNYLSISVILFYFILELYLTFYFINRFYKSY
jgi:hypothetical protein